MRRPDPRGSFVSLGLQDAGHSEVTDFQPSFFVNQNIGGWEKVSKALSGKSKVWAITFDISVDDPSVMDSSQANCKFSGNGDDKFLFKLVVCCTHLLLESQGLPCKRTSRRTDIPKFSHFHLDSTHTPTTAGNESRRPRSTH